MGRISINDVDNYNTSSGSSFFALKDDGETARIRFMYNTAEDIEGYAVHEFKDSDGKKRYVSCLRDYTEPKSKCPFCAANVPVKAKIYIPVYDEDEAEVKLWERGKNFFQRISTTCSRFSTADTPVVSTVFEVTRHGKKNDTQTFYEWFPVEKDETRLEDLPEIPEVLGHFVLEKTAEEMKTYLETGSFDSAEADDFPVRRTPSRRSEAF